GGRDRGHGDGDSGVGTIDGLAGSVPRWRARQGDDQGVRGGQGAVKASLRTLGGGGRIELNAPGPHRHRFRRPNNHRFGQPLQGSHRDHEASLLDFFISEVSLVATLQRKMVTLYGSSTST